MTKEDTKSNENLERNKYRPAVNGPQHEEPLKELLWYSIGGELIILVVTNNSQKMFSGLHMLSKKAKYCVTFILNVSKYASTNGAGKTVY